MNELYELREKLCKELKKYSKEEVTTNTLGVVDELAHAIKNIDKIIEKYEEEEAEAYYPAHKYGRGYKGYTYSRGRGSNAKRDSMGRYADSHNREMINQLREMMMDAPNDEIRREYEKVISHIESM